MNLRLRPRHPHIAECDDAVGSFLTSSGNDENSDHGSGNDNGNEAGRRQEGTSGNVKGLLLLLFLFLFGSAVFIRAANTIIMTTTTTPQVPKRHLKDVQVHKNSSQPRGPSSAATASPWTWTSPHEINCTHLVLSLSSQQDTGMFMPIRLSHALHHDNNNYNDRLNNHGMPPPPPFFLMNIHNPHRDGISKRIFQNGCYECHHLSRLSRLLLSHSLYSSSSSSSSSNRPPYLLDVGANIGMWTATAAALGLRVVSIEPVEENYQRICRTVVRNGWGRAVRVLGGIAATERNGEVFRLEMAKRNFGGSRVVMVPPSSNSTSAMSPRGFSIDSLRLPVDRPVVLKVDVEGHELHALRGAMRFLREAEIVYAVMELRPDVRSNPDWKEVLDLLVSKGLTPYRVNYEGVEDTKLDVNNLEDWKHFKHPVVKYFDVAWRRDDL